MAAVRCGSLGNRGQAGSAAQPTMAADLRFQARFLQLAIGADSSGEQAASLLGEVFGRLAADNAARPQPQQFQELLGGLDEVRH